jgi:DNA-directed RNA polymerase subunit RPC12/RpoP
LRPQITRARRDVVAMGSTRGASMDRHSDKTATMLALTLAGRTIRLRCRDCGHRRVFDPLEIAARHGDALTLDLLARRASCSKCGSRRHSLASVPARE